jgi:hypothetical protein
MANAAASCHRALIVAWLVRNRSEQPGYGGIKRVPWIAILSEFIFRLRAERFRPVKAWSQM